MIPTLIFRHQRTIGKLVGEEQSEDGRIMAILQTSPSPLDIAAYPRDHLQPASQEDVKLFLMMELGSLFEKAVFLGMAESDLHHILNEVLEDMAPPLEE
jgi:hypothetical protein